jgi:two-component system phosphate regulon response regulator PhoB
VIVGVVLVVEDDPEVRSAVVDVLADNDFRVAEAATGREAIGRFKDFDPDVVLLDLGLPDVSGLDLLMELTEANDRPVIVLSGRSGEADRVIGLDLGADDYITKPFSERELVARVKAALRRTRRTDVQMLVADGIEIDLATREVAVDGRLVSLRPKEFDLLVFMARSPRHVFSRTQLLQHIWGSSSQWQDDSTVAEHIHRVRRKLDPDDRSRWIQTVRGVGYRFSSPGSGS